MSETKQFRIDFYQGQLGADGEADLSTVLAEMAGMERCPAYEYGKIIFELRNLHSNNNGATIRGVFAKIRCDNLPHTGAPGGVENELDLAEEEGLIEKNHFVYYRQNELLVYQKNGHGSTTKRFEDYLSNHTGVTALFNPIPKTDSMRRLMSGENHPRSLQLSVARPSNPDLFPSDNWNRSLLELMNGSGGMVLDIAIRGDGHSRNPHNRYLLDTIKGSLNDLLGTDFVRSAKVQLEGDDFISHPVDLIADRIYSKQRVQMNGRYPCTDSMFAALGRAKEEVADELNGVFGNPDGTNLN